MTSSPRSPDAPPDHAAAQLQQSINTTHRPARKPLR
jgi:hypothetical protein